MSLRGVADSLVHISDALDDATMASPSPVYTLVHPLGLVHHAVSLATPIAPLDTLQIAATIVATTLTHMPSQISGGGGGGSKGGGGGSKGGGSGRGEEGGRGSGSGEGGPPGG